MSEWKWIDRKEREPEPGQKVLICFCDGDHQWMTPDRAAQWAWSHWMPIPPPPPKTVTIEISEEDAVWFAGKRWCEPNSKRMGEACRKALENRK